MSRTAGFMLSGLLVIGIVYANGAASEENHDPAALAQAMQQAKATLETGLKASEREGKPISAKFEVEDNNLQLSVYTLKGNDAIEVIEDPQTGVIVKSEKITEDDDLQDAQEQKAAMATAKTSLLAVTETAVKENSGFRAVSVFPKLQNGHPVAEVTLLQGTNFKKVTEKLD